MANKYRAQRTVVNDIIFASKREANRYRDLLLMHEAHEIEDLELQVPYRIEIGGQLICRYIADFVYVDRRTGEKIVEDCKGYRTPMYKLKRKLMSAVHGIDIYET